LGKGKRENNREDQNKIRILQQPIKEYYSKVGEVDV